MACWNIRQLIRDLGASSTHLNPRSLGQGGEDGLCMKYYDLLSRDHLMDHKAGWTILGEISCINILNVTFYGSTDFRDTRSDRLGVNIYNPALMKIGLKDKNY